MKKVAVIGSGFAGLSAAACLAKAGFEVTVYEKNSIPGGRARRYQSNGFTFDLGPSFYWMPEVFERFFALFDKKVSDYYELERLDPSYRIFFGKDDYLDVPAGVDAISQMFERLEPGSSKQLAAFLAEGKLKYDIGINELVYKPGLSLLEFADWNLIRNALKLHVFSSVSKYVRKFFKNPRLVELLEFPVLFLGATPQDTPALYTLMNYADIALGTWYPKHGMYSVVEGMVRLAEELGVRFQYNSEVTRISVSKGKADAIWIGPEKIDVDFVVAAGDYEHIEQHLLPAEARRYSSNYWEKRVMAPSSLLFYIGLNTKLKNMAHHTLFFDVDFSEHAKEIYKTPRWPKSPQFYTSCTSVSDPSVAPEGHENLVILVPVAPGLKDEPETRARYYDLIIDRLEKLTSQSVREHVVFQRSYAHNDFIQDYHAWKGNAYGLANTLLQTAHLRPSILNKKVTNLFYTGQLTVPGPGVPPSIISGQVVAKVLMQAAGSH